MYGILWKGAIMSHGHTPRALPDGIPADLQDAAAEVAERYSGEDMDQFERDAGAVPGLQEKN